MAEKTIALSNQEKEEDEWVVVDVDEIPKICESWENLMDINHTSTFIRKSLPDPTLKPLAPEYPCLITLKGSSCKFYHPNHVFTMDFPELSGFYIRFSKFGWLLLSSFCDNNYAYSYFFFNPYTRQKIDLPICYENFFSVSFSSPPTSSNCFVIGMGWKNFGITKRGEQTWDFYGSLKTENPYLPYSHLALCGNRCYAIGDDSRILVFDLKRKSFNFLSNPIHKDSSFMNNIKAGYLVENGTKLLAVMVSYEEQNIYIRRMTPSKQEWLFVQTLKNEMLFVSKTSSMLKPAPTEAASNMIYFPKILNDVAFIPYCLDTKKYILGDHTSGSPWSTNANVKQWTNSTWIETMPFLPSSACNQQINW